MNSDLKNLWCESFLVSKELISVLECDFYKSDLYEKPLPIVNYERLAEGLLSYLKKINKIDQSSTIEIRTNKFDNDLYGVIELDSNTNTYYITINDRLNDCKRRFTIIKELCQLYFEYMVGDSPFNNNNSAQESINSLVYKHAEFFDVVDKNDILLPTTDENYNEFFAYFMALNLIIPNNFRDTFEKIMALVDQMSISDKQDVIKSYDVAYLLRQPEHAIIYLHKKILPFLNEGGL